MKRVSTTLTVAFASMLMAVGCGSNQTGNQEPVTTTAITTTTTTTPKTVRIDPPSINEPIVVTTTTEPTKVVQSNPPIGKCSHWYDLAISVGWPTDQWEMLNKVMYRESRCNIDSYNASDPNGGSRGLLQINGFWCRPNKYTDHGWLQDHGILNACDDLYNPEINLRAGLAMFFYSTNRNGNGWHPWRM